MSKNPAPPARFLSSCLAFSTKLLPPAAMFVSSLTETTHHSFLPAFCRFYCRFWLPFLLPFLLPFGKRIQAAISCPWRKHSPRAVENAEQKDSDKD
jgi:hypothetical protein